MKGMQENEYWRGFMDGYQGAGAVELLPVTEELPELNEEVVVRFQSGVYRVAARIINFRGEKKFTLEDLYGKAEFWMPLPESPA